MPGNPGWDRKAGSRPWRCLRNLPRLVFLAAAPAFAAGAIVAALVSFGASREASILAERAYRIVALASDVMAAVLDAETGQRGFLLTGEDAYLAPYGGASARVRETLAVLEAETLDQGQRERLATLRPLVEAKLAELARTVALRHAGNAEEALRVVRTDEGRRAMDAIRQAFAAFEAGEQALLDRRLAAVATASRRTTGWLIAAAAGALGCLGIGAALLLREQRDARRRAEGRERATGGRLDALLDNAPLGIAFVGADLRFVVVNAALAEFNGVPVEAHRGRKVEEVVPLLWPSLAPHYQAALREGRTALNLEVRGRTAADPDTDRDWLVTYYPVRASELADAPILGIGVVVLEVSARRRAEDEVRRLNRDLERRVEDRTARLMDANEALEAFAYGVSHDLRAPLRAIGGFARLLAGRHAGTLDADGRRYVARILAAAERMDGMILDLLAYARLERAEVMRRRIDLGAAVRAAVAGQEATIQETRARVAFSGLDDVPPIFCDAAAFEQALANLITNALKFVRPGTPPVLHIRAETPPGEDGAAGTRVRLWVEDEGIGIPPAERERIFAPLARLHGPDAYPGTGLGLSLVRRAIERCGGAAGVEAREGGGSRFWIELPAAARSAAQGGSPQDDGARRRASALNRIG